MTTARTSKGSKSKKAARKATTKRSKLPQPVSNKTKRAKAPEASADRLADRRAWLLPTWVAVRGMCTADQRDPGRSLHDLTWGSATAAPARVLVARYRLGPLGPEAPGIVDDGETFDSLKPPPWFVSWEEEAGILEQHARETWPELFEIEGGFVDVPLPLLYVERRAGEPGFQSRALLPPRPAVVATMREIGVLDALKVMPFRRPGGLRRGMDVTPGTPVFRVVDGRQRWINACAACSEIVTEWFYNDWEETEPALRRELGPPQFRPRLAVLSCELLRLDGRGAAIVESVSNAHRRDLKALEQAEAARTLKDAKLTHAAIARQLEISEQTAAHLLSLTALDPKLWGEIQAGRLPLVCGYELAKLNTARQVALWEEVKGERNKLEALRQRLREPGAPRLLREAGLARRSQTALVQLQAAPQDALVRLAALVVQWLRGEPVGSQLPPAVRVALGEESAGPNAEPAVDPRQAPLFPTQAGEGVA